MMTRTLGAALLLLAVAGCTSKSKKEVEEDAGTKGPLELFEQEPNERPDQALPLTESSEVTASLGADPSRPDEDWYRLSPSQRRSVEVRLSAVPGVALALELTDPDRNPLLTITPGEGKPANLKNLTLSPGTLIRVRGAKKGQGGAYVLGVTFSDVREGFEAEPNERSVDATSLSLGQTISGHIGHSQDADWYRVELGEGTTPVTGTPSEPSPPEAASPQVGSTAPQVDSATPDAGEPPSAQAAQESGIPPSAEPEPGAEPPVAAPDLDGGVAPAGPAAVAVVAEEPPGSALRIELGAVPGVALELQLLSAAEAPLFTAKAAEGQPLSLRNVGVRAQDRVVYAVVRSSWIGSGKEQRRASNPDAPYTLQISLEEAGATSELEPNDALNKATPLAPNSYREGFLSPRGDVDHYVVQTQGPSLLKAQLSGVERLDLVLSVVQPGTDGAPETVTLRSNDGAVKEPEQLNNIACEGTCYFRVEGGLRKVDGKMVRDFENPDTSYRLSVTAQSDTGSEEREPNGKADVATPLTLGKPIRGTIYPKKDSDLYRLDLSEKAVRTPIRATLTGILKVDVGLYLHRLEEDGKLSLVQTADRGKGDATESIRYSAEPGVYVVEVKESRGRNEANFQDPYQLTVQED